MKKILLILAVFTTLFTFSQNSEIIGTGTSTSQINGDVQIAAGPNNGVWIRSYNSKSKVEGSYYLFNNWANNAAFYLMGDKKYKISKVNFNIKFNRFEAYLSNGSKDSIFAFNSQSIKKVIIRNKIFVKKSVEGKGSNFFLEMIQEGHKLSLLKSYDAVIRTGTINPMTQQKINADKIDVKSNYFIERNGKLEAVKLKQSTILKLMSDKKMQIKSYLKKNKSSFKKDDDVRNIFIHYNSII